LLRQCRASALGLVRRADAGAVELVGRAGHALVDQAADDLAVFEDERHLVGAYLEHRAGALVVARAVRRPPPSRIVAEAGVEEAGVVSAELTDLGIVGGHLGGVVRRYLDRLARAQDVKLVGIEDQAPRRLGRQRVPELGRIVGADPVDVDQRRVAPRAEPDQSGAWPIGRIAAEVDGQVQGCPLHGCRPGGLAGRPLGRALGRPLGCLADQPDLGVDRTQGGVARCRRAAAQAQLVEPRTLAHQDREGLGRYFGVERTPVAGRHAVELAGVVDDQPHEDIQSADRGLGVGPAGERRAQRQALLQFDDVDAAGLQYRARAQVDLVQAELGGGLGDLAAGAGQEAGADPVRRGAQAQIQAGGLDLVGGRRRVGGDFAHAQQLAQHLNR